MPHKQARPYQGIVKYVNGLYEKYPERKHEIDACLSKHRLPDGSLKYDDAISIDLKHLSKKWRRKAIS
jgi:hypothetical protein